MFVIKLIHLHGHENFNGYIRLIGDGASDVVSRLCFATRFELEDCKNRVASNANHYKMLYRCDDVKIVSIAKKVKVKR